VSIDTIQLDTPKRKILSLIHGSPDTTSILPPVSQLDGLNRAEKTAYSSFQNESSINTIEDGLRLFCTHRGRVIAHTSKTQHESSTVNEEAHT
jgi:hypothetical protein